MEEDICLNSSIMVEFFLEMGSDFFFLLFINSLLKHKVRRYILRNKSLFCL